MFRYRRRERVYLSSDRVNLSRNQSRYWTSIRLGVRQATVPLNCTKRQATFLNAIILHSIFEFEKRTCSDVTLLFLNSFFVQHAGAVVFGSMPKNGGLCPPRRARPQSKRFAASEGLGWQLLVARRRRLRVWRVDKARVIIFFNRMRGDFGGYLCYVGWRREGSYVMSYSNRFKK